MSTIENQIEELVAAGFSLDDILVNEGNSEWGDDCAVTRDQASALRAEWMADGQTVSDLPNLPTATQWLGSH